MLDARTVEAVDAVDADEDKLSGGGSKKLDLESALCGRSAGGARHESRREGSERGEGSHEVTGTGNRSVFESFVLGSRRRPRGVERGVRGAGLNGEVTEASSSLYKDGLADLGSSLGSGRSENSAAYARVSVFFDVAAWKGRIGDRGVRGVSPGLWTRRIVGLLSTESVSST